MIDVCNSLQSLMLSALIFNLSYHFLCKAIELYMCPLSSTHWGSFEKQLMNGIWMRRGGIRRQEYSRVHSCTPDESKQDFVWHALYNYIRKATFNQHTCFVKMPSISNRRSSLRPWSLFNTTVGPNNIRSYTRNQESFLHDVSMAFKELWPFDQVVE